MKILAIETSCDETGIALVEASGGLRAPKFRVIKNLVASQIKIHRPFGGVVPNLAKREHLKNLPLLWQRILNMESRIWNKNKKAPSSNSKFSRHRFKNFNDGGIPQGAGQILNSIDLIAVTVGPGLEPALWTGIEFAKELYKAPSATHHKPLAIIGVNHLEGHLYSFLLPPQKKIPNSKFSRHHFKNFNDGGIPQVAGQILNSKIFPAVVLLVSGGHTTLLKMDSLTKWKKLGETRDDAAGEAFDKVARMLELPYPGGPEVEKLAASLRKQQRTQLADGGGTINFPRPMIHDKSYDFSFSGLKTSVLYYLRDHPDADKKDVAASFQNAAIDVLTNKTMRAAREFGARSVILCGGVAANKKLRSVMGQASRVMGVNFFVPDFKYNLDNAAMIAAAGYMSHLRKKKYKLTARGDMSI